MLGAIAWRRLALPGAPVVPHRPQSRPHVRLAGPERAAPAGPSQVQRRVSSRGVTQVAGQTLHVGFAHRHTLVDTGVYDTAFHVHDHADEPVAVLPRTTSKEVTRPEGVRSPRQDQKGRNRRSVGDMLMRRPTRRLSRKRRRGRLRDGAGGGRAAGGGRLGGGGRRGGDDDARGPTSPEPQHPVFGTVVAIAIIVFAFMLIPVMLVAVRLILSATGIAPWTD